MRDVRVRGFGDRLARLSLRLGAYGCDLVSMKGAFCLGPVSLPE